MTAGRGRHTTVTVVVGAQFGDEAKGKITDFLAAGAKYVVRTAGGPNAGHSIHLPEAKVVLHQLACGVLRSGVTGVSGPGMVIDPVAIESEIQDLDQRRLLKGSVAISDRAHVILPLHTAEDAWEESVRARVSGHEGFGTTLRGIGPAAEDRYGRWGIRIADLARPAILERRLQLLYETKGHLSGLPDRRELQTTLSETGARLAPFVQATEPMLWDAATRGEGIILEGAQSALLDVDFGTYPYVTSSHPTAAGALVGSGLPPQELDAVVGVAKAYSTRVGAGPFPSEELGELGDYLRRTGGEHGATTGRPRRCGWIDFVLLRYAARLNGFTSLALTKVDVLGGLDSIPVCVRYDAPDGSTLTDRPPTISEDLDAVKPVYEHLPAWPEIDARLRERLRREGPSAIPAELREFLRTVTRETRVPVEWVSFGPQRDDTVWLGRGGEDAGRLQQWSG